MPASVSVLREWTRFALAAWRAESAIPPAGQVPAEGIRRFGLAPLLWHLLNLRSDSRREAVWNDFRLATCQNALLAARVTPVRDALLACGISPVLIKGSAFLLRYSPGNWGIRQLADFNLLVEGAQFSDGLVALMRLGWEHVNPRMTFSNRVAPSVELIFADEGGGTVQLDLHRSLALWPLVRGFPALVARRSGRLDGWRVAGVKDSILIVGLHRARHVFANDGRDLFDLAVMLDGLGEEAWADLLEDACSLGLAGALYGALLQAAWWFGNDASLLETRLDDVRARLPRARVGALNRMARPVYALTHSSPFATPLGRHFAVFPSAFDAPVASLVAAAMFLPARLAEGRGARTMLAGSGKKTPA